MSYREKPLVGSPNYKGERITIFVLTEITGRYSFITKLFIEKCIWETLSI